MNKLFLTGRLVRDPEIRYTQTQTAIASFALAVDKRDGQAIFVNCTAFGKTAEHVDKYWRKGMKALISGRLDIDTWTTKEGQKRTDPKVIIEEIEFCERKEDKAEKTEIPEEGDETLPFKF